MYNDNGKYIDCRINLCNSYGEIKLEKKSSKKVKNGKYTATRCIFLPIQRQSKWLMEEKPYTILGSTCYRRYSYSTIQSVFVAIFIPIT